MANAYLSRFGPSTLALAKRGCVRFPRLDRIHTVRCFAGRGGRQEDKSWGELAEDAVDVAKSVVGKIVETGKQALGSVTKKEDRTPPAQRQRDKYGEGLMSPGGLVGGLLGRAVGGLFNAALSSLGEQIKESQRQTKEAYDEAAYIVQNSREVQDMLGEVVCQPPYSQSSSSQSINGVVTKRTSLLFPVVGSRGTADVQVDATEGRDGLQSVTIKVRLPNGRIIDLDDKDGSSGGGRTIDAEWTEVK